MSKRSDKVSQKTQCLKVLELVQNGFNTCSSIAIQMNVSKGYVSQLAKLAKNNGWIRKRGRKYSVVHYQRLTKGRLVPLAT
jgi:hypothetical protein